jgi:hypothetical protein
LIDHWGLYGLSAVVFITKLPPGSCLANEAGRGKDGFLVRVLFILFPQFASLYLISIANVIGYTVLSAMGVSC